MEFIPRPYQKYAIDKIIRNKAVALLLDMGMGKTAITLTAIKALRYDYFDVQRVLVIAPKHVAEVTWTDEAAQWDHTRDLRISVVIGSLKARETALASDADVYVINRENVIWLVSSYGKRWPFDMVVIDESSSFKNPQAKRFRALKKVRPAINRIVELTGTPSPNGLMDLWSQIYLLDGGLRLGRFITHYRAEFFTPDKRNGAVVYSWKLKKGKKPEDVYSRIRDIVVSMRSSDYLSLPPVTMNVIPVRLGEKAMKTYKTMEKNLVLEAAGEEITALSAATLSNKLLQLANGAIYDDAGGAHEIHRDKLDTLAEVIDANEGKSIMVFYYFKHDLQRLKKAFPTAHELKTPDDIHDWNAGKIPLLLVHPASAGHGLNLQHGGHIAIWFGLTWSLEQYLQANKRLHRPGQRHPVIIHHLVAKGTIDEDVMRALRAKEEGQDALLEAVKARLREYQKEKQYE